MLPARGISDFVEGILFLPRGASYLVSNRRLWPYAILPLLINIFIVLVLGGLGVVFFPKIRSIVWGRPEEWYWLALWYAFSLLLVVVLLITLFVIFLLLLGLIGGPFNSKLALRTREALRGEKLNPAGGIYADVLLPVVNEVKKFFLFILLQVAVLFLNLIPAVGTIAYAVTGSVLTFLFLAYAFLEYSIETEEWIISLRQRFHYLLARVWPALGFGCALSLLFFIPVIDFFLAPVAVVGAVLLYEEYGGQKGLPFCREK